MSYIYQHPQTVRSLGIWAGSKVSTVLTPGFFFWNPGSEMQKSSVGLLRSLLYQIFRDVPDAAPLPQRNEPLLDWTEKRLTNALQSVVHHLPSSHRMCLFVDGLDEFSGDDDALIALFQDLVQNAKIKAVLSSRPYLCFDRAFRTGVMMRVQDLTRHDIEKFVSDKLYAHPKVLSMKSQAPDCSSKDIMSHITSDIIEKSDGVFLWVELAVKDLIRGIDGEDTLQQLQDRLQMLPTKLEDMYALMLDKIEKVYRTEAAWFLQLALLDGSRTLLDYTIATHDSLDQYLESSNGFPSQSIISQCGRTKTRIAITCAGLLEVHEKTSSTENVISEASSPKTRINRDSTSANAIIEDTMLASEDLIAEDAPSENLVAEIPAPESDMPVAFLHRTVVEFLKESEQAKNFLHGHSSPNRNIFVVWAKVLVAKLRMFGYDPHESTSESVVVIMEAVFKAENETDVAQMAVCEYLDLAMATQDKKRCRHPEDLHWCDDCARDVILKERQSLMEDLENITLCSNEADLSGLVPVLPTDFLGVAASHGLKRYVDQQLRSLPADVQPRTAEYLLCCATNPDVSIYSYEQLALGVTELIRVLLEYVRYPTTKMFQTIVWGQYLDFMLAKRHRLYHDYDIAFSNALRTTLSCFLKHGADSCGMICIRTGFHFFSINREFSLEQSKNPPEMCGVFQLYIKLSIYTLIQYCLDDSPASQDILSSFALKGALPYSKCTEVSISCAENHQALPRVLDTWIISEQQSSRLISTYKKSVMATRASDSVFGDICRVVLQLYDELSPRKPDKFIS